MTKEISNDTIELRECIVGHIDVLGAKALLNSDEISFITTLRKIIEEAKELCSGYNKSGYKKAEYKLRIFSDNLCFYAELPKIVDEESKKDRWGNIVFMFLLLSALQYIAILNYKILLRGGVSIGNLYYNDDFIIGKALSDAYVLEDKNAIYSRILIDKEMIKDGEYPKHNALRKFLTKDTDGKFMLDYLIYTDNTVLSSDPQPESILKHKEILLEKLKEAKKKPVKEKIRSSIYYHNRYCKRLKFDGLLIDSKLLHQKFGFASGIFRVLGNLFK